MSSAKVAPRGVMAKSCVSCRKRRQKCDRAAPECLRCKRLLLRCDYGRAKSLRRSPSSPSLLTPSVSPQAAAPTWRQELESLEETLRAVEYPVPQLCRFVHRHKQGAFADAAKTFGAVMHPWLPVIDPKDVDRAFALLDSQDERSKLELYALLFSLACVCQRETCQRDSSVRNPLYNAARILFVHAQLQPRSVVFVQAGLLLATAEYGLDLMDAAHSTISTCRSAAQVQGIIPENISAVPWGSGLPSLCWILILVERLVSLENSLPVVPLIDTYSGYPSQSQEQQLQPTQQSHAQAACLAEVQAILVLDRLLFTVRSAGPKWDQDLIELDVECVRGLTALYEQEAQKPGSRRQSILTQSLSYLYLQLARHNRFESTDDKGDNMTAARAASITRVIRVMADTFPDHPVRKDSGDDGGVVVVETDMMPPWAVMTALLAIKVARKYRLQGVDAQLAVFHRYVEQAARNWELAKRSRW